MKETRQSRWHKKNTKTVSLKFCPTEKYMLDFLQTQEHPYTYIKQLIRQAAERNGYGKRN